MALSEYQLDIRKYPGWFRAYDHRREHLKAAARRYIVEADASPIEYQTSTYHPGAVGYRALFLVAAEDPTFISRPGKEVIGE